MRSHTLRAKFGVDKIKNAVHCTDLPDDALLEVSKPILVLLSISVLPLARSVSYTHLTLPTILLV